MENNPINLSVIIPLYNVEEYLPACLDSLMNQDDLVLEIILVNDGSTDRSGEIAEQYAQTVDRMKVIHQKNGGASVARNAGLKFAQGEYIAFFDSDDWVKENSLYELYRTAKAHQADVVMGKIWYYHPDGNLDNPRKPIPGEFLNIPLHGKECFVRLFQFHAYPPMVYNYIYRKEFLEKINVSFEEGIMYEDALWTPVVLCQAERMLIIDHEFYYYRQHEKSVMQTTSLTRRLKSLFRVTDLLIEFADRFDFTGKDEELKNWWIVHVFFLYSMTFNHLSRLKDSSIQIPEHHLGRFWRDCWKMMPVPQKKCRGHFRNAEANLKKYTDWRTSEWVASVAYQLKTGKKLMLIYNTIRGEDLSLKIEDVPADWVITTDRRYVQQADAVVFYLPDLHQDSENVLDKSEGQIWVSWYQDSEKEHPSLNDADKRDTYDMWLCCHSDEEQIEHPLVSLCKDIDTKLFEKDKVLCPCCGKTFGRFVHFDFNKPYVYDAERFKSTYKNTVCPYCFSMPRHRIACYYFDSSCIRGNILMFGAENSIKKYFDKNNKSYTTADLFKQTADLKIDMQDIQLPDEQWSLIICNHVLEHVHDYKKALMELNRILKKGGILEITVPTDRNLETVYEPHSIATTEERIKILGQNDHLRIFGNDFDTILNDSGFCVEIVDGNDLPAEIVGVIGPANYDDNRVYICRKIDKET